jgi:hypothetical protein
MLENAAISLAMKVLSPIVIGLITPFAVDGIKSMVGFVDKSPAYVKQGLAIAIAAVGTALTDFVGADIPTDLALWDGEVIKTLVAGFLAIAIKQHKQLKKAKR